jgi:beta-phosphoglucomutase-like phosphatase (HAD superfamily)
LAYLDEAKRLGLQVAVVSSSSVWWIEHHFGRLGRLDGWSCVVCADGDAERAKPRPTLYLEALARLGIDASDAIAFEDSPNGVAAAKAAGIYSVAVPNPITKTLDFGAADLVLESFQELPLGDLLARVGQEPDPAR